MMREKPSTTTSAPTPRAASKQLTPRPRAASQQLTPTAPPASVASKQLASDLKGAAVDPTPVREETLCPDWPDCPDWTRRRRIIIERAA
jgi:hypothetical protein